MAEVIAEFGIQLLDSGEVRHVGYRDEAAQHAAAVQVVTTAIPGSVVVSDPWETQTAAAPVAAPAAPRCIHGPLKAVPGGIAGPNARNPGSPYAAFWACQAPQGQPKCKIDRTKLPPVPA